MRTLVPVNNRTLFSAFPLPASVRFPDRGLRDLRARSHRRWYRLPLRWGEHALAILGGLLVVYHVGFDTSVVVSSSMAPTLRGTSREEGEWVLLEKVSYWFRPPRRWEVVSFIDEEFNIQVTKRVVGLPGESVSLRDDRLHIDGEAVPVPESLGHLKYMQSGNLRRGRSVPCGDGYYVLGDDSMDSEDSRFTGPIARSSIRGRVWLVVSPLSAARFVNP